MHKRTAHAIIDSDDGVNLSLQESLGSSSQNRNKRKMTKEIVSIIQVTYHLRSKDWINNYHKRETDNLLILNKALCE